LLLIGRPLSSTLFPYTTLFRSLDVRVFELDVQAGCDAIGDHARLVAKLWRRCIASEASGKQQADAIGSTEVQVVADDGFEEVARSEEHTSELQSLAYLVCRLLL